VPGAPGRGRGLSVDQLRHDVDHRRADRHERAALLAGVWSGSCGLCPQPITNGQCRQSPATGSTDAGKTWTSLSGGLQIDAAAYQRVLNIAPSPDFATDQTLYVAALGPWSAGPVSRTCGQCVVPNSAVFRSHWTTDGAVCLHLHHDFQGQRRSGGVARVVPVQRCRRRAPERLTLALRQRAVLAVRGRPARPRPGVQLDARLRA
jgi:hypothetical protein